MRDLRDLNRYRLTGKSVIERYGWAGDDKVGAFSVPSPVSGERLLVVASSDAGWDHISVSKSKRIPNYREMVHIKRMFFLPEETAMELHVPEAEHINRHPNTLHLWSPHPPLTIPLPPSIFV